MTEATARQAERPSLKPLAIFPLVGPAATVAAGIALVACTGSGTDGRAVVLTVVVAATLLPAFYALLAPPFFLAGLFYGLARRKWGAASVPAAFAASMAGFAVVAGVLGVLFHVGVLPRGWLPGTSEPLGLLGAALTPVPAVILRWRMVR